METWEEKRGEDDGGRVFDGFWWIVSSLRRRSLVGIESGPLGIVLGAIIYECGGDDEID